MAKLTPLRRRMIEDMTIRNLPPPYVHAAAKFSRYLAVRRTGSVWRTCAPSKFIWCRPESRGCAEPDGVRAAVLLRRDAGPCRESGADRLCSLATHAAGVVERRRSRPS